MPKNTPVHRCYEKLVAEGKSKAAAAKICQTATKTALETGKPPKMKGKK